MVSFQRGDPVWEVCRQTLIRARLLTVSSSSYWMLIRSNRRQDWLVFPIFLYWASAASLPIISCPLLSFCVPLVSFAFHRHRLSRDSSHKALQIYHENEGKHLARQCRRVCLVLSWLTIWRSFICIVYCSLGTWSLASFNILSCNQHINMESLTGTPSRLVWLLIFPRSTSQHRHHSIWSKDLFGILLDSPWFSPLSVRSCARLYMFLLAGHMRIITYQPPTQSLISFQQDKISHCSYWWG